jgi:hypothetical protein
MDNNGSEQADGEMEAGIFRHMRSSIEIIESGHVLKCYN